MNAFPTVHVLARNWWTWLIRGIAAVIFGILAFLWPGPTIVAIGILFGAYALVDGVFAILATIRAAETHQRWWPFLAALVLALGLPIGARAASAPFPATTRNSSPCLKIGAEAFYCINDSQPAGV